MSGYNRSNENPKDKEGWFTRFWRNLPTLYFPFIFKYMTLDPTGKKTLPSEEIIKCKVCDYFDDRENICRRGYSTSRYCKEPYRTHR